MQLGVCTGRKYPKDFSVYGECVINIPDFIPEKVTKILHKILVKGCEKCESCSFYQKADVSIIHLLTS